MKRLKVLLMVTFVLFFSSNTLLVMADNDHDEYGEHVEEENEALEEGGEAIGWGTVVLTGLAGVLLPMRRSGKQFKRKFPSLNSSYIKVMKFLGKWHITFGIAALLAAGLHGLLMYFAEGELDFREILGIGSILFVTLSAIVGGFLAKNKRIWVLRTIHISLISTGGVLAVIHILLS